MEYVSINKKNIKYFEPLLPRDVLERLYRDPLIYGLGIVDKKRAIGILVYSMESDNSIRWCNLLYIAVSMEYQRNGIARDALMELARVCYDKYYYLRLVFPYSEENPAMYNLVSSTNAFTIRDTTGNISFVTKEDIRDHILIKKAKTLKPHSIYPYKGVSLFNRKSIDDKLRDAGYGNDFIRKRTYKDYSYYALNDKGKVDMFIIINPSMKGNGFEVSYLYSAHPNSVSVRYVKMLTIAFERLEKIMTADTKVYFTAINKKSEKFIAKLFPKLQVEEEFMEASYDGIR